MKAPPITEAQFATQVSDAARIHGWSRYHTWTAVHSPAGFPDEVLLRPPRLIFAELKSAAGKVSEAQQEWLDQLHQVPGVEVYVWRPSDWDDIIETLTRQTATKAA